MFAYDPAMTEAPPLPPSAPPLPPAHSEYPLPSAVPPPTPCVVPPPPLPPSSTLMAPPTSIPQFVQPPLPPMTGEEIKTEPFITDVTSSSWLDPAVGLEQTGPLLNGPGSRKDVFSSVGGPLSKLNDHQV